MESRIIRSMNVFVMSSYWRRRPPGRPRWRGCHSTLVGQIAGFTLSANWGFEKYASTDASFSSLAASSSRRLETGAEPEVVHLSNSKRILSVASSVAVFAPLSGARLPRSRRRSELNFGGRSWSERHHLKEQAGFAICTRVQTIVLGRPRGGPMSRHRRFSFQISASKPSAGLINVAKD